MAEVDSQVYLVRLGYIELVSLVLHVHSNELIANLRSVLSIVYQAELLGFHFLAKILIFLYLDTLRLNLLLPSDLV